MNRSLLALCCLLAACTASPELTSGRWTGTLTPMNHPEMANAVAYEVRTGEGRLSLDVIGPGGTSIPTRAPHLRGDTLFFSFEEPEV